MGGHYESSGMVGLNPDTGQLEPITDEEYERRSAAETSKTGARPDLGTAPHQMGRHFDGNDQAEFDPAAGKPKRVSDEEQENRSAAETSKTGARPDLGTAPHQIEVEGRQSATNEHRDDDSDQSDSDSELAGRTGKTTEANPGGSKGETAKKTDRTVIADAPHEFKRPKEVLVTPNPAETKHPGQERGAEKHDIKLMMEGLEQEAEEVARELKHIAQSGKPLDGEERKKLAERVMSFMVRGHDKLTETYFKHRKGEEALNSFVKRHSDLGKQLKMISELAYAMQTMRDHKDIPTDFEIAGKRLERQVNDSLLNLGNEAASHFMDIKVGGTQLADAMRRLGLFSVERR